MECRILLMGNSGYSILHCKVAPPPPSHYFRYLSSVSLLHSALTSPPSYLAGKEAERRIEKTQTLTTQKFGYVSDI